VLRIAPAPREAGDGSVAGWVDRVTFVGAPFDLVDLATVLQYSAARHPAACFAYVVTPNAAHVATLDEAPELLRAYEDAALSLCDSRIIAALARLCGLSLPVATGSDLVAELFAGVIRPGDTLTIIGCPDEVPACLRWLVPGVTIHHHNPPMGFLDMPGEIERCVEFVLAHPARFVFFAVGMPQQEAVAHAVWRSGAATGTGLCIGGALFFVAGSKLRAPIWMQRAGLEWLHRLCHEPARLAGRYLIHSPKILRILLAEHGLGGIIRCITQGRRAAGLPLPMPRPLAG
jgi:exopolysaccharide biosynthesis WecB/TagA/CpsF family protein